MMNTRTLLVSAVLVVGAIAAAAVPAGADEPRKNKLDQLGQLGQ
jgi:hypothetical protein